MTTNTENNSSLFTSEASEDLIKGWNEKRQSNNEVISGLTPFVQLIGLFNLEDYRKMLSANDWADKRQVYYVDDGQETEVALGNVDENLQEVDLYEQLESKLSSRYINLYMADVRVQGSDNSPIAGLTPSNGIVMAEAVSQSKNHLGGIGITDLQIDYGKQAALGARTYTMRLTVTDPSILNDRPEYSKLATQFGEFLLLYGWSNPTSVPGYDAIPPPVLEPDINDPSKQMMVVPLVNMKSGGYWSAARVNISKYDFSFNEVGQLDITAVFRDMTTIHLTTTKLSTIAPTFKRLFATADYDPRSKRPGSLGRTGNDFLNLVVTNVDGASRSIVDNFIDEQNSLNVDNTVANSSPSFIPIIGGGTVDERTGDFIPSTDATLTETLDALEAESSPIGRIPSANAATFADRQRNESQGFPRSIGIATYEKVETLRPVVDLSDAVTYGDEGAVQVADDTTDEDVEMEIQTDYKIKTVYYYLGWIMEGVRLCLADANRSRVQEGEAAFNPKFFYLHNEDTSKLSSAFQRSIARSDRANTIEERIQLAIIRLKEKHLPPIKLRRHPNVYDSGEAEEFTFRVARSGWSDSPWPHVGEGYPIFVDKKITPCMGKVEYEGLQTAAKDEWVAENLDVPNRNPITYDEDGNQLGNDIPWGEAYRHYPMRGVRQETSSMDNGAGGVLGSRNQGPQKDFGPRIFLPDYPAMYDNDGVLARGSEEGYNPRRPTLYKAASRNFPEGSTRQTVTGRKLKRGTFFYYKITYEFRWFNDTYKIVLIEDVDTYRKNDLELWNSTQHRWNNLFRRYLGTYFEKIIRLRIAEIQAEGRTVEDIFDEPVDLDFLTGRVYHNNGFSAAGSAGFGHSLADRRLDEMDSGKMSEYIRDLEETVAPKINALDAKISGLDDKIAATKMEMNGEEVRYQMNPEEIDPVRSGYKPDGTPSANKILQNILGEINVRKTAGVIETRARGTNQWGIPYGIEFYTGGKYTPGVDEFGNRVYTLFKPWRGFVQGTAAEVMDQYEIVQRPTETVYTLLGENEAPTAPSVEYFMYRNGRGNPWPDYAVDVKGQKTDEPLERVIAGQLHTMQQSTLLRNSGGEEEWMAETNYNNSVRDAQIEIDNHINRINELEGNRNAPLNVAYRNMRSMRNGIQALENEKIKLQTEIAKLNQYMKNEDDPNPPKISLYDDTSAFDDRDPTPLPCGRDERLAPMLVTTHVAKYFKKILDSKHSPRKGVRDIENYGPAWGGTQYYYPSNIRRFLYDPRKAYTPIQGSSRVILDPVALEVVKEIIGENALGPQMDIGAEGGDQEVLNISPAGDNAMPGLAGLHYNWGIFGNPGIPNDIKGQGVVANQYGFFAGPRILENGALVGGGSWVANYGEFLELFGLRERNEEWPGVLKIVGSWPRPQPGVHYEGGNRENGTTLPYFYMIDDANNIVMPGVPDPPSLNRQANPDQVGSMVQTGYYLGYYSAPVYLYPDRHHAVQVDPSKDPSQLDWVTQTGNSGGDDAWDTYDKWESWRRIEQNGDRNAWPRHWHKADKDEAKHVWSDIREHWPHAAIPPVSTDLRNYNVYSPGELTFGDGLAGTNYELVDKQYQTRWARAYGPRLFRGDHNMNLNLDQKRTLVIPRGAHRVQDEEMYYLGVSDPGIAPDDTDNKEIDWSNGIYNTIENNDHQHGIGLEDADLPPGKVGPAGSGLTDKPPGKNARAGIIYDKDGHKIAPKRPKQNSYGNENFPFGTGFYRHVNHKGDAQGHQRGSFAAPEHSPNENYLYMGDFLDCLPGNGFFTQVNNNDHSPTTLSNDGTILEGAELNIGVVKYIIENVLAPIGKNRRIGSRMNGRENNPRGAVAVREDPTDNWAIVDTTYRHLFFTEDNEAADEVNPGPSFANLDNLQIDSAGDIPIRRDIVDNLMTKNNTNMSIAQFFQEITRPGAIGINTGSINMGFRQRADGVYEVFQANKNWRDTARKIYEDWDKTTLDAMIQANRYPNGHLLFDYKANDSLIENINMNSKFDPAVALTFKRGAMDFTQDSDVFAKFLAYGNIAPDLVQFLAEQDAGSAGSSNPTSYAGAITVGAGSTGIGGRVIIQKDAFTGDNRMVPQNVISQFLMQKPERQAKLNTFLQMQAGGNFTTQLMANYMRSATITIHGTVNIIPFNTIHIRGILPDLEGVYLVTNTRDSISPGGFSTVLNAVLLEPLNAYQNQTG